MSRFDISRQVLMRYPKTDSCKLVFQRVACGYFYNSGLLLASALQNSGYLGL
jgi:hypothetical protein